MKVIETADPIWECTIPIPPRTKKNSQRIISVKGRPLVIPSKPYKAWEEGCGLYIGNAVGITAAVSCRAMIYRDKDLGDASNYYNAIGDMLQKYGIVANDRLIVHWDGSRLLLDRQLPRLELALFTVETES